MSSAQKIFFELVVGDGQIDAVCIGPGALRCDSVCALISRLGLAHKPMVEDRHIVFGSDRLREGHPIPRGIKLFFFANA